MSEITLIGNITGDPELRFVNNGAAVASFTVASTPRKFDKTLDKWVDGEPLFLRCSIWREAAENVAESLTKGTRVVVVGKLEQRSYEDKKTGEKRTAYELKADEVAVSLKYAQARVSKVAKGGSSSAPAADPWGSNEQAPF